MANVLLIYVPPSGVSLAVLALVATASLLLSHKKLLPLAVSLAIVTIALEAVSRLGETIGITPYYRPHEMLARETSYEPNRKVEMNVPHGDLLAIDPRLPRTLAESRLETFSTDSLGYRNEADYNNERLVVVGDSFLVGTATYLSSTLGKRHGLKAYNLAFAGMGPLIYADKIDWARKTLPSETCIALFYFEGNDFQPVESEALKELAVRNAMPRGFQRLAKGYVKAVRGNSEWAKVFFGLVTRSLTLSQQNSSAANAAPAEEITSVRTVGGKPMVFLNGYANVVRRKAFDDYGFVRSQLLSSLPDIVFLIPDKFRVYSALLDERENRETELPHAQWAYLRQAASDAGIQAVDLTARLVDRSRQLLETGETTYWRDDTHWNEHGEDVAAEVLLETLRAAEVQRCRVGSGTQ